MIQGYPQRPIISWGNDKINIGYPDNNTPLIFVLQQGRKVLNRKISTLQVAKILFYILLIIKHLRIINGLLLII